jgi:hypothetical protein
MQSLLLSSATIASRGLICRQMDECRRKAKECLRWADEAANDRQRETLLEIARLWTQMELSSAEPNGVDGAARVSRFSEVPKS